MFICCWILCSALLRPDSSSVYAVLFVTYSFGCAALLVPRCRSADGEPVFGSGVNMPDHGGVFGSLAARLRRRVSQHVAVLEAASCSTVQATVRAMVRQLTADGQVRRPARRRRRRKPTLAEPVLPLSGSVSPPLSWKPKFDLWCPPVISIVNWQKSMDLISIFGSFLMLFFCFALCCLGVRLVAGAETPPPSRHDTLDAEHRYGKS